MRQNKWQPFLHHPLFLSLFFVFSSILVAENSTFSVPSDALALLAFKSKADLQNNLPFFSPNDTSRFCKWAGIQCLQFRVVRLVLQGLDLRGTFANNTLTRLDQLRVLSLQNNSLTGPVPDLSGLRNLKSLFLDHNSFSGSFPPSILFLHRLRTVDFSYNNLTGSLPAWLANVDRISYLRLEWNHFNGSVPPMNQSALKYFNVSGNNFTGAVPVTPTLLRFDPSSFSWNPGLCGEIIHKECNPSAPFFGPTSSAEAEPPAAALGSNAAELTERGGNNHRRTAVIVGFSCGVLVLVCSLLCFAMAVKKQRRKNNSNRKGVAMMASDDAVAAEAAAEQEKELEEKVKRAQQGIQVAKSGSLAFCAGEAQLYSLEQLMRASAELLGRGTIGTTYKAVLDNRLIVSVKRLDAGKLGGTSREVFETHMESVGGLRHPNLVPLRAYFQAKEERLLIYDYQPNGSLFSLIHGKPRFDLSFFLSFLVCFVRPCC